MNRLRIRLIPDSDGTGELEAHVSSDEFAGVGKAYFNLSDIVDFAGSLKKFPLSTEHPPTIDGGFGAPHPQCHLRLRIQPYNARGVLLVKVDLATKSWDTGDRDLQQHVSARFLTEYAPLNRFADEMRHLVDGAVDEAILIGRETGPT